jgi:hypothetical protein
VSSLTDPASAGFSDYTPGNSGNQSRSCGELPAQTTALDPAAISATSPQSLHCRPLAFRVLFTVPKPSPVDPRGLNPQALNAAALSWWVQGFEINAAPKTGSASRMPVSEMNLKWKCHYADARTCRHADTADGDFIGDNPEFDSSLITFWPGSSYRLWVRSDWLPHVRKEAGA